MKENFLSRVLDCKHHIFYKEIPDKNILEKDRYRLFYLITIISVIIIGITEIEILDLVNFYTSFSLITVITGFIILANFTLLNIHKKPVIAYLVFIVVNFVMINYHSLHEGGIKNPGLFYFLFLLLISIFLIGIRAGLIFTTIAIADFIFLYYMAVQGYSIYDPVIYSHDTETVISNDFIVTLFTSFLCIFYTCRFINNSIQSQFKQLLAEEKEKLKFQKDYFQSEQKALRSQMNPHFIFNSLNTVQDFILKNEEQHALNYLSDFSLLMRKMMTNSKEPFIALNEEIDFLKKYIVLEQVRYDGKFNFSFSVHKSIDEEEIKIPPMLIQPIVENSIKHGIASPEQKNGVIKLSFIKDIHFLVVSVEDNGIGIEDKILNSGRNASKDFSAIEVIRERLHFIINEQGEKGKILFEKSNSFEQGTNVTVWIPL